MHLRHSKMGTLWFYILPKGHPYQHSGLKRKKPNLLLHRTPNVSKRYVIKLQNVAKKIVTLMWWHIGHVYSINSNESRERSLWSSLPKRTNRNTACNQRLLFICTHEYNFSCYIPNNRSKGRRSKFLFVGKRQKKGGGSSHFLVEQTD